ncbi:MAG: hypothetical protein A6F70_09980 [Cycloclasticus sp. symbiont of Bathymodiolus heckerae]|nr:MAG: hypothetical protein A6F70_09980 [Cycloclasticus sp. symbiont of Bathymodiolus heckerae]
MNPDASLFLFDDGDKVADARHVSDALLSWIDSVAWLRVVFHDEIEQSNAPNNSDYRSHNDCK